MRHSKHLSKRVDAALEPVEIPVPWDLEHFLKALGRQRGRPIILAEAPELAGATSANWLKGVREDFIFYAPTQSTFYLELNVFHEVGHMICGHDIVHGNSLLSGADLGALIEIEGLVGAEDAARTILSKPGIPVVFARNSRFDSTEEREAELAAYKLKLLVDAVRRADPPSSGEFDRLHSIMRRTLGR